MAQGTCRFPGLSFRTAQLEAEFLDEAVTDPRVRAIALELALVAYLEGATLEVTQIGRTLEEQQAIYGYDKPSGHCERPARAIDFSSRALSERVIGRLLEHFARHFKIAAYYSLLHHDVGCGQHLHLQVGGR